AYDVAREVVVLFGGRDSSNLGDTWEWDGQAWTERLAPGPSPRRGHTMAYDMASSRTLLFGGHDGASYVNDTWAWDGNTWRQLMIPGPQPRSNHSMTYDTARSRIVVFGGYGVDGTLGDTWEYATASCLKGDVDNDATISIVVDVHSFSECLLTGATGAGSCTCADMDASGAVDGNDIQDFVLALID
ncbi:MAG: hypothetical protein KDA33_11915, partial [Phycisphaerales bacterium]|nr:hypothetical protein [Phycisphaerales bacterium]